MPFKNDFDLIYLWLCWAAAALHGLSLVADCRLFIVVTPWVQSAASTVHGIFQARILEWVAISS